MSGDVKAYGQGDYDHENDCRTYYKIMADDSRVPVSEDEFWEFIKSRPQPTRAESDAHWESMVAMILERAVANGWDSKYLRAIAHISDEYGDFMTRALYDTAPNRLAEQT